MLISVYSKLNIDKITEAIQSLALRIKDRFPDSNLLKVCHELEYLSKEAKVRIDYLNKPFKSLRIVVYLLIISSLFLILYTLNLIIDEFIFKDVQSIISTSEAFLNEIVMIAAAFFFVYSFESNYKQKKLLELLHELRTIIHIIDMHQLTKDPGTMLSQSTTNSPERKLSSYELSRYLDYCSEMLSLTSKLAAGCGRDSNDHLVLDTIHNIEILSSSISGRIWQKINIINSH